MEGNPLNMNVDELAAILRQVQSGHMTVSSATQFQQQQQQKLHDQLQQVQQHIVGHQQQQNEDDAHRVFSAFSQEPLRRPGRAPQSSMSSYSSSAASSSMGMHGSIKKQISAVKMRDASENIANRLRNQHNNGNVRPGFGLQNGEHFKSIS